MYNCGECGGHTNSDEVGARYQRHHDECTCIRCEECGEVTGNKIESAEWNHNQALIHHMTSHTTLTDTEVKEEAQRVRLAYLWGSSPERASELTSNKHPNATLRDIDRIFEELKLYGGS